MASTSPELVRFEGLGTADEQRATEPRGPSLEPDFEIHTLDELVSDVRRRRGPVGTVASFLAHGALAAVVIAVPLLRDAPTLMDGVPVPVLMTVTVRFDLKKAR